MQGSLMYVLAEDMARIAGVDPERFREYVDANSATEGLREAYEVGGPHHRILCRLLWTFILTEIRKGGNLDGG